MFFKLRGRGYKRGEGGTNEAVVTPKGELLALTERKTQFAPEVHPFLNESFGTEMAQNIAFTGQPTVVHAGVNSGALLTGTTTGTTSSHLIDSGETFSGIAVGMSVKNTTSGTEYALVTAVASNDLTLDADIFVSGENYEINPIWVGAAVQGTWNFADSGRVSLTSGDDNDEASFDNDTLHQWSTGNGFTAFTGDITLTTYNDANNTISLNFDLNGVQVGNTVALDDFIDTGSFSNQPFVIPKADLGIGENNLINGMTISLTRLGGAKPTFSLDAMQWEEIGAPAVFKATTPVNTRFHITELRIAIADVLAATVTNGTMHGLAYDAMLGESALSNGIAFRSSLDGETLFSVNIKQLGDFLATGSNIVNAISDGTNTFITLLVEFREPIILTGPSDKNFLSFTINDNLSGLLQFTAAARGGLEKL